jgi:hypothetical protein
VPIQEDLLPKAAILPVPWTQKSPPHLDGGRALYHNAFYQSVSAALVTASIADEAAMRSVPGYPKLILL